MDGAIAYGKPGKRTPMWLSSIMKLEMQYLHDVINGLEPSEEFAKLLTGEAATNAIATADAATLSSNEGAKLNSLKFLAKIESRMVVLLPVALRLCRPDKAPVNCAAIRQWTGHIYEKSPLFWCELRLSGFVVFGYKTAFNSVTIIVGSKGIKSTLATPDKRKGSCAR